MAESSRVPDTGLPFSKVPEFIFTNWLEALHLSGLSAAVQTVYAMAIQGYLDYCTQNGASVAIASARAFMSDVERRGIARQPQLWKDGINWYFAAGRRPGAAREDRTVPSLGQADTSAAPWERRLIERLRLQHYAWRTEKTYREWIRDLPENPSRS
jgi:hypothetical protein